MLQQCGILFSYDGKIYSIILWNDFAVSLIFPTFAYRLS